MGLSGWATSGAGADLPGVSPRGNTPAAIADAHARSIGNSRPLVLGADTYDITEPLVFGAGGNKLNLLGTNHTGQRKTTLRAVAPMPYMVKLTFQTDLSNIVLDANGFADHCVVNAGASESMFTNVDLFGAKSDGWLETGTNLPRIVVPAGGVVRAANVVTVTWPHQYKVGDPVALVDDISWNYRSTATFPAGTKTVTAVTASTFSYAESGANAASIGPHEFAGATYVYNDNNQFWNFRTSNCGHIWTTDEIEHVQPGRRTIVVATAATQADSDIIVFTGLNVRQLGLRTGDPLCVGNVFYLILRVTADDRVQVLAPAAATASGLGFSIGRGGGFNQEHHGDNGISEFFGGLHRHHAGPAMAFHGLYGPLVYGGQFDFLPFHAIRVGSHGAFPCIGAKFYGQYFEAIRRRPFALGGAQDFRAEPAQDLTWTGLPGTATHQTLVDYLAQEGNCNGKVSNRDGEWPVGTHLNYIPTTKLQDCTVEGTFAHQIVEMTNPTGPWELASNFVIFDPTNADRSIDHPVLVAGQEGRVVKFMCKGGAGHTVTLRDEADLAGSKLKLGAATRVLAAGAFITLACDGSYWWEA